MREGDNLPLRRFGGKIFSLSEKFDLELFSGRKSGGTGDSIKITVEGKNKTFWPWL